MAHSVWCCRGGWWLIGLCHAANRGDGGNADSGGAGAGAAVHWYFYVLFQEDNRGRTDERVGRMQKTAPNAKIRSTTLQSTHISPIFFCYNFLPLPPMPLPLLLFFLEFWLFQYCNICYCFYLVNNNDKPVSWIRFAYLGTYDYDDEGDSAAWC